MKNRQRKSACTAATVASANAKTSCICNYNTTVKSRQARKQTDRKIRATLSGDGIILLVCASGADNANLLSGWMTFFVAAVGLLAMWVGGAHHTA